MTSDDLRQEKAKLVEEIMKGYRRGDDMSFHNWDRLGRLNTFLTILQSIEVGGGIEKPTPPFQNSGEDFRLTQ